MPSLSPNWLIRSAMIPLSSRGPAGKSNFSPATCSEATNPFRKRIGSLSSVSRDSHATLALWDVTHVSARVVFPEPAGAEITVSGHGARRAFVRRGRATIGWRSAGGRSFVFGIDGDGISKV
jgi:hypothetical protein